MVITLLKEDDKDMKPDKLMLLKGSNNKQNMKIKKLKVHGNFDKKAIIDELEGFSALNHLPEKHPDMKIEYQKHCDGWRGFIEYEDTNEEDEEILLTSEDRTL